MLKKLSKLFLGLVVCTGSACVTPTHASSAISGAVENVVISHIQASGEFGAKDEYVILHNNSAEPVEITNWCLLNKAAVQFACFVYIDEYTYAKYYLPPYSDAVIVSVDYSVARPYSSTAYSLVYEAVNGSSGSIVNSSDSITLVNGEGEVIDTKLWSSVIPTGKILTRNTQSNEPVVYMNTSSSSDWSFQNRTNLPINAVVKVAFDIESDDPPVEPEPIPELEIPSQPAAVLSPIITEILPNPAGSDEGREFIELYNPNDQETIVLESYTVRIGTGVPKSYSFPAGASIPPLGYVAFSNEEMGYTLVNTTGKVQLAQNSQVIGEGIEYNSPKDDYSWALIDGVWQYGKPATPGSANDLIETESSLVVVEPAKACATNQFRNPETGRCKLIAATSPVSAQCKPNQERNPSTNRCRNIVTAATPTPCKEGQERNPETKRCRTVTKMSKVGNGVEVQTKTDAALSWYYWAAIIGIVALVLAYAVWEWREELGVLLTKLRMTFAKHPE